MNLFETRSVVYVFSLVIIICISYLLIKEHVIKLFQCQCHRLLCNHRKLKLSKIKCRILWCELIGGSFRTPIYIVEFQLKFNVCIEIPRFIVSGLLRHSVTGCGIHRSIESGAINETSIGSMQLEIDPQILIRPNMAEGDPY